MRKITLQEAMTLFEDDDVWKTVTVKNYLLIRRYKEAEWVYVELP